MNFEKTPLSNSQGGTQVPIPFGGSQHSNYQQQYAPQQYEPQQYGPSYAPKPPANSKRVVFGLILWLLGLTIGFCVGYLFKNFRSRVSNLVSKPKPQMIPIVPIAQVDEKTIEQQHQEFRDSSLSSFSLKIPEKEQIGFKIDENNEDE